MAIKFKIHQKLRFPLIWVIFFAIIGIVIQSIKSGNFIFFKFFFQNYINWFKSFGSFVDPTAYSSLKQLFYSIMSHWYYFFYTAGLISLIWNILSILMNSELNLKQKPATISSDLNNQPFAGLNLKSHHL